MAKWNRHAFCPCPCLPGNTVAVCYHTTHVHKIQCHVVSPLMGSIKTGSFLTSCVSNNFSKKTLHHEVVQSDLAMSEIVWVTCHNS